MKEILKSHVCITFVMGMICALAITELCLNLSFSTSLKDLAIDLFKPIFDILKSKLMNNLQF